MTSKAVNVPTDLKAKEKDVNAKLQLYGIYAAFANGKVPSVSALYCHIAFFHMLTPFAEQAN